MTRHVLTLVWNRKRTTLLLMAEIAVAFLVLTAVSAVGVYTLDNWRRPVGITWDRVWDIEIDRQVTSDDAVQQHVNEGTPAADARPRDLVTIEQLLLALRDLPEVEMVTAAQMAPFEMGAMSHVSDVNGRRLEFGANEVLAGYGDVLGLKLSVGRWPGPEDVGQAYEPVVINEHLRETWFGSVDPIGQPLYDVDAEALQRGARPTRIVGVVEAYREDGEFDGQHNAVLYGKALTGSSRRDRPPRHLLIRVRPGTPAAFEERLVQRLLAAAPTWSFEVRTLEAMRDAQLRFTIIPLALVGALAGSLLLMVGLGLLGVMWQAVTQRTREMGLRRAKGATRVAIARQVLSEILVMVTLAVVPAALMAAQVPLLDASEWVPPHVYVLALALSLAAIYVLALFCGWYPARLATAVEPAEALRYE